MSMNLNGRAVEFRVKEGSITTLYVVVKDYDGLSKNLTDTDLYATAKWKVWKPDGTLLINGNADFYDRGQGIVSYDLVSLDTLPANQNSPRKAGVWEGEVEIYDSLNNLVEQTNTFNFIIEESY